VGGRDPGRMLRKWTIAHECRVCSPAAPARFSAPRAPHPAGCGGCGATGPTSNARRSPENTLHSSTTVAQTPPSANNSWQGWFSLPIPCAPWTPSAFSTFEVTQTRSLVISPAHDSMFQVLTGTRSGRAHRMWPDFSITSSERNRALQDAAPHRPRAVCAVRGCECTAAACKTAAFAYSFVLPRCQMVVVAAFGRCSWLVSV